MFESSRLTLESAVRDGEEEAAAPRKHPGGYLRSEVAIIWLFIQLFTPTVGRPKPSPPPHSDQYSRHVGGYTEVT